MNCIASQLANKFMMHMYILKQLLVYLFITNDDLCYLIMCTAIHLAIGAWHV